MWSLGKVLNTPEVMRVYIGSVIHLRNKTLHAYLYSKKLSTFNECYIDTMHYDGFYDLQIIVIHMAFQRQLSIFSLA